MLISELRRLHFLLDPFTQGDPRLLSHLTAFAQAGTEQEEDDSEDEDEETEDDEDGDEDSGKKTSKKTSARKAGGSRKTQKADEDDDAEDDEEDDDDDKRTNQIVRQRLERDRKARARKAGFDSWDEMEKAAKAHRDNEEQKQTEVQRLTKVEKKLSKQLRETVTENQELKLDLAMTRFLSTDYPELAGHEEWIMPRLLQDIEDDDWDDAAALEKIVKRAVKAYAEKNGVAGTQGGSGQRRNGSDFGTGRTPQRTRGGAPNAIDESAKQQAKRMLTQASGGRRSRPV